MNKKAFYTVGVLLLLLFAGFSYSTFKDTLTPYVSYEEARNRTQTVQVAGGLLTGSSRYDSEADNLHFTLTDPESGDELRVRYAGLKPANFEEAISIVAIGRFDAQTDELEADKLLVKCPSKYQGLESTETKSYG